jgi:hypothetical protein
MGSSAIAPEGLHGPCRWASRFLTGGTV